jgi:SagB-type dehydrogenase family enzyme
MNKHSHIKRILRVYDRSKIFALRAKLEKTNLLDPEIFDDLVGSLTKGADLESLRLSHEYSLFILRSMAQNLSLELQFQEEENILCRLVSRTLPLLSADLSKVPKAPTLKSSSIFIESSPFYKLINTEKDTILFIETGEVFKFLFELAQGHQGHSSYASLLEALAVSGFLQENSQNHSPPVAPHELAFHYKTRRSFSIPLIYEQMPASDLLIDFKVPTNCLSIPISEDDLLIEGPGFLEVLTNRKSTRTSTGNPLSKVKLKALLSSLLKGQKNYSFPSAGGLYELELFLVVQNCEDLEKGVYYFSREKKALLQLESETRKLDSLLEDAAMAYGSTKHRPDVLLVYSSNLSRMKAKYGDISYRLSLLNAGVLIEHHYTMSSYLEIGCCSLGTQDSALFTKLTGIDSEKFPSIAEIALFSLD